MKEKSLIKNFLYKSCLNLFNIVVPLIIGSYAYKVLGEKSMGKIVFADAIYAYFLIFASFGIYNYGLREISRIRDNKEKLKSLFSSLFLMGLFSNILVLIVYISFILFRFKGTSNMTLYIIYMFSIFSNIFYVEWANEALEKYDFITIKTIAVKVIYVVLLLGFIKNPEDYLIYAGLLSGSIFLNNIISFIFISKDIGFTLKGLTFKKHIKYLIMALIMSNANVLYTQLDRLFIGSYLGETYTAFYAPAQNIVYMIYAFIMSIVYVTIPRLSNILASEDEEKYLKLLNKATMSLSVFLFPAAVGIFVLSREIILLYTKESYLASVPVLKMFSIYMISLAFDAVIANQIIYVKRKEKILLKMILSWGLVNLAMKLILAYSGFLSPFTAILSTTIVNYMLVITEYAYVRIGLKVDFNLLDIKKMKYLFISLIFIPISYGVKMITSSTIYIILITMTLCVAIYFSILLIIKDEILLQVLDKMLIKLRKKSK